MDGASTELTDVFNLHCRHREYALQGNGCRDAGTPAICAYLSFAIFELFGGIWT